MARQEDLSVARVEGDQRLRILIEAAVGQSLHAHPPPGEDTVPAEEDSPFAPSGGEHDVTIAVPRRVQHEDLRTTEAHDVAVFENAVHECRPQGIVGRVDADTTSPGNARGTFVTPRERPRGNRTSEDAEPGLSRGSRAAGVIGVVVSNEHPRDGLEIAYLVDLIEPSGPTEAGAAVDEDPAKAIMKQVHVAVVLVGKRIKCHPAPDEPDRLKEAPCNQPNNLPSAGLALSLSGVIRCAGTSAIGLASGGCTPSPGDVLLIPTLRPDRRQPQDPRFRVEQPGLGPLFATTR
jgi:hypothetical protein